MCRIGLLTALVVLSSFRCSLVSADEAEPQLEIAWSINEGLKAPESAYYHADSGVIYLSQIGEGGGKAKDGDGWISKISTDGEIIENKWVTGLNAPKGVRGFGGTLYVSDIDRIVAIDIAKGQIADAIEIPDAVFLNDLATGPDGTVYVSDMAASKVYQYRNGKVSVFAEGEELEHPNGVLVAGDSLIIGGWGTGFNQDDFSTEAMGRLQKINLKTRKITTITPDPAGHLDGIEVDGQGGYIVTDWRNGKLFRISRRGKVKLLMSFPRGAADHAYLVEEGLIILPQMMEGSLTAFRYRTGGGKSDGKEAR